MEKSLEEDNFVKLSYILLDVVAEYLREYFIKLWDETYPDEKWHGDLDRRSSKLQSLLVAKDGRQKKDVYSLKIMKGNEQEWDITTSIKAILDSGFKLIEGSRPPDQRNIPLRESEEIEIIRGIRNSDYGHIPKMACPLAKFNEVMTNIKSAANSLFGENAEKRITYIENSPVTPGMTNKVITQLEGLKEDIKEVKEQVADLHNIIAHLKGDYSSSKLQPYTEKDIDELKNRYKVQYKKHSIHKVDKRGRIYPKEVDICEFAVALQISEPMYAAETFKDETRRHFELLKGMKGKDVELSELINHNERVVLIHGIPGMGKTIVSKQLAFLWACNKIYTQFELCIIMECRDLNNFAEDEGSSLKKHKLFDEFLKTRFKFELEVGAQVLFIVDGLDELFDINSDDSVIWQLLDVKNTNYTMAKIILTGRPHVEEKLERQDREIGGLQRFELQGLNEEQIKEYIYKFASCEEDIVKINKAIESSKGHIGITSVPEFLNSLCCVAILSKGEALKNAVELYVWVLYLLLKQHVDKEGTSQKTCCKIFLEYSSELKVLCEICHELLSKNRIIFEGNVRSRLLSSGKGTEFLLGLFVECSDNRTEKYQFKHLTLMEFLSAVHICQMKNRMEIIKDHLQNGLYQVVIFSFQLIGGCKYDGIIRDMLGSDEELKAINVQQFLASALEVVCQCVDYKRGTNELQQQCNQLFQLSIDITMCFINKEVASKMFVLSAFKALHCNMERLYWGSMRKVSEICERLSDEFNCTEGELKETFKNVLVEVVVIGDVKSLTFVKYLQNVKAIELWKVKADALLIRKQVNEIAKCKEVDINYCALADDKIADSRREKHELKKVLISGCSLNRNSFINICKWTTSSVKEFHLYGLNNIEHLWLEKFVDTIEEEKKNGRLALKKLEMWNCDHFMREEMLVKV